MPRVRVRAAIAALVLSVCAMQAAQAQHAPPMAPPADYRGGAPFAQQFAYGAPAHAQHTVEGVPAPVPVSGQPMYAPNLPPHQRGAYPYLHAPMYPTPQPNIPYQVGATVITNQAFYPQEMLYRHEYDAMYAPFYYKVKGHWMIMPWGVVTVEDWELQGTEVEIEYRPHVPLRKHFTRPFIR